MILLELFLTFLQIDAFSFGGGYGMISLIREKVLTHGWLTEEELLNMIAVAESTPGPIAVNMATFVGSSEGGILGALLATLGVVLPSFVIILLLMAVLKRVLKYAPLKSDFVKNVVQDESIKKTISEDMYSVPSETIMDAEFSEVIVDEDTGEVIDGSGESLNAE